MDDVTETPSSICDVTVSAVEGIVVDETGAVVVGLCVVVASFRCMVRLRSMVASSREPSVVVVVYRMVTGLVSIMLLVDEPKNLDVMALLTSVMMPDVAAAEAALVVDVVKEEPFVVVVLLECSCGRIFGALVMGILRVGCCVPSSSSPYPPNVPVEQQFLIK